jgi:hypothetical protein
MWSYLKSKEVRQELDLLDYDIEPKSPVERPESTLQQDKAAGDSPKQTTSRSR